MKLDFRPFDLKLRHTWTISSGAKSGGGALVAATVLVRLTDGGLTGLGEAPTTKRYAETPERIQEFLRRVDPAKLSLADVEGSMAYLQTLAPLSYSAVCGLNTALIDGAARAAGKAVCDYFGLGFTEKKHITSMTIGIDTPERVQEKTAEAAPYPALKLKVGVPQDRENIQALRRAAPAKRVRVDANEGWTTREEALEQIEWFAKDPNVEFIEQPMPAGTPAKDLAWLKSRSPLPIFGDESYHHASDAAHCAECYHGVNVKLVKTGGVSGAFAALQAAQKAGLQTMVGCMIESSILISAAAHLAELTNYLDVDGNLLITNDPYAGCTARNGMVSFAEAQEKTGLRVRPSGVDPFA
ncbi:MAG TPA: dipeptide epimerase [Verrucomicrobiae bacterium]|jgi:L-alanine-DL-glutamate epimerase-like enolase superfamily enzyme|nr:dipeptide epimerase [Verrucomicrobiae bacterium]